MVLRLAGGDLNALLGLAGFGTGIWVGVQFLHRGGFTLKRTYFLQRGGEGYLFPVLQVCLLLLLLIKPAFLFFSDEGPGALRAPWLLALVAGLIIGGCRAKEQAMHGGGHSRSDYV